MHKFYESERLKHEALIEKGFFAPDFGNGLFRRKRYKFVLKSGLYNLFEPLRDDALKYFEHNGINWWSGKNPTGHVLSSQIACVNHLMLLRKDHDTVLSLINSVRNQFKAVLPINGDKDRTYIAFEVVSDSDHLDEGRPKRGANCTSIDALILALDRNDDTWLIPIEWKYTECYDDYPSCDKSAKAVGQTRMSRYNLLIDNSRQLRSLHDYNGSIYYYEPFYQLMRQTLWAEQMIDNRLKERIKANYFLHIHVIPADDTDLLNKRYRITGKGMEETWRSMIADQSLYVVIDPKNFMSPVQSKYPALWNYLCKRYY